MECVTEFCPAKINLFLAVTGRRDDGFHELVSVAAPVAFGDTLVARLRDDDRFALSCDDPAVPCDGANLVLKAAEQFRKWTNWPVGVDFELKKITPMGAGLGGGSSDGVGALKALNRLAGEPLGEADLAKIAATLGSDCPLFLAGRPVVIRGRGERLDSLDDFSTNRLVGPELLVLKPPFGIHTAWAYGQMAAVVDRRYYLPEAEAETRLQHWIDERDAANEALGFNSFERCVGRKFQALPTLAASLERRFGRKLQLSGSGSACYVWPESPTEAEAIESAVREAWGKAAWIRRTRIPATKAKPD